MTSIGNYAFEDCDSLTSVTIGDSVTSIRDHAFKYCDSLTSITIPDSVTSIGEAAFYSCDSLTSVTIGDSVTSIGDSAFSGCDSLTSITIPDSVTSIGDSAFSGCDSLTSVTIGDSVTSIGDDAFYYCTSLTSVTIGDSVTSIGNQFNGCTNLETIIIPQSVTSISDSAFDSEKLIIHGFTGSAADSFAMLKGIAFVSLDGFMATLVNSGKCGDNINWELYRNGKLIITGTGKMYNDTVTTSSYVRNVEISDGITSIGNSALEDCDGLTSITIPDSVTSIGGRAFYGCDSLTSVIIPDSVTDIGYGAFSGCDSLTSITIPNSVTSIGDSAFYSCTSLTSITIPDSVTSIGSSAFCGCDSLTSITIPDSVTSIGDSAFSGCDSLTSVTIGDCVTSIGDYAFYKCTNIEKVNIKSLEAWMNISFYDYDSTPLYYGADLYLNNAKVINVTIPDDMTKIKANTFYGCKSLKTITIPKTVTTVPESAFTGCTNATFYSYAGTAAETTAKSLKLPFVGLDEDWKAALVYNGKCGNNTMWQLYQDGNLVLSFMNDATSDVIFDYSDTYTPTWNSYASLVRNVEFPEGITKVGTNAFAKLTGIMTVRYGGSEDAWKAIEIADGNQPLRDAFVLYEEETELRVNYKDVVKTTAVVNGKVIPVIINLESGTTWQELKDNLIYPTDTDVIVYDADGKLISVTDVLSTGYVLHHVNKDGYLIEESLISVSGDVTGDSEVNVNDVQTVLAHLAGDNIEINKIAIDKDLNDVLTFAELNKYMSSFAK